MAQLQLLDLMIRTEKVAVPIDATVRANLIDLMASILMAVFHAEGGVDDRGPVQSQDQAGTTKSKVGVPEIFSFSRDTPARVYQNGEWGQAKLAGAELFQWL